MTAHVPTLKRGHENVALPVELHQTVDIPVATRIIIVGDVHGCYDELQALLLKASYNAATDRVILVGDLVNKGPKSCEVVRFARENNVLCVRGNHDDAALNAFYRWKASEGHDVTDKYDYVAHFSALDVAFLEQLPFTITLPAQNAIIVHAGLMPGVSLPEQQPLEMYKMRVLVRPTTGTDVEPQPWQAREKRPRAAVSNSDSGNEPPMPITEVKPWATEWPGPRHVYFGHDAKSGLQQAPFATGLDTGCCYGRELTAIILPTHEIVSVPAQQDYAPKTDS